MRDVPNQLHQVPGKEVLVQVQPFPFISTGALARCLTRSADLETIGWGALSYIAFKRFQFTTWIPGHRAEAAVLIRKDDHSNCISTPYSQLGCVARVGAAYQHVNDDIEYRQKDTKQTTATSVGILSCFHFCFPATQIMASRLR